MRNTHKPHTMVWSSQLCLKLIDEYEKREELWNPSHPYYYRQNNKIDAWKSISNALGFSVYEVRRKMETLHGSFRRERAKLRRKKEQGVYYESQWFAYHKLEFLSNRRHLECKYLPEMRNDEKLEEVMLLNTIKEIPAPDTSQANPLDPSSPKSIADIFSDDATDDIFNENSENFAPILKKPKCERDTTNVQQYVVDTAVTEECDAFANFLSKKLQSYSRETRCMVQYQMHGIIYDADTKECGNNNTSNLNIKLDEDDNSPSK